MVDDPQSVRTEKRYTAFFFFSGEGGGALGAQQAPPAMIEDAMATCEVLGGIDVDPLSCADAQMWTGVTFTCLDLFDRHQYEAFHGKPPGPEWSEVTLEQVRAAAQNRRPNIAVITAPCKGMSGLLGKEKAKSRKYDEGLNGLTFRGVFLALEAWKDDPAGPPDFIIFENVKGMKTRGKRFLEKIKQLLFAYGYHWHDEHYDCGEWGGLGQRRIRFKGFARRPATVPCYLYHPQKQRVRSIEEVLQGLPRPMDPDNLPEDIYARGGPMNILPRNSWKTQVRLALIPPGKDWRALKEIKPGQYCIVPIPDKPKHYDIMLTEEARARGIPIMGDLQQPHMEEGESFPHKYQVTPMDGPAPTATGSRLGSGAIVIAQPPEFDHEPRKGASVVQDTDDASLTVTGDPSHRKAGGASVIADPNLGHEAREGSHGVGDSTLPAGPVLGSTAVTSSNGMGALADPSFDRDARAGVLGVQDPGEPSRAVTWGKDSNGDRPHVAWPIETGAPEREDFPNSHRVTPMDEAAPTVTTQRSAGSGALIMAEPDDRIHFNNMLKLPDPADSAPAVTAAAGPHQSANLIADPAFGCDRRGGTTGVADTTGPAPAVIGAGDIHNAGASAVADPNPMPEPQAPVWDCRIPNDNERGVWYIRSPHRDRKGRRCWHRAMVELELLVIQGFPWQQDGYPVTLAGKSRSSWRERIGNAWPPPAAAAIFGNMLMSLLASETVGFLWDFQQTGILVRPDEASEEVGTV